MAEVDAGYGRETTVDDEVAVIDVRPGTGSRAPRPIAELVSAASDGDVQAWNGLVERFSGMVWAVARSHRLNAADAADVSQTTWLRLVEHLDRIDQPERVGAWLATTARRESLRVLRLSGRQVPTSDEFILDLRESPAPPQDADMLARERDQALRLLVGKLPERCQLILRLLLSDPPLSYRDLGEALEMPIGSIGPTRARCLEHLRKLAESEGISLTDLAY